MNDAELSALFAKERDQTLAALEVLLTQAGQTGWQAAAREAAIRHAHSLKGAAAAMGEAPFARLARLLEEALKGMPLAAGQELSPSSSSAEAAGQGQPRWRVAFVPTPTVLASQTLREEVDRSGAAFGYAVAPCWDEVTQPPQWEAVVTAPADAQRVLRDAFELFAVPGTLVVTPLAGAEEAQERGSVEELAPSVAVPLVEPPLPATADVVTSGAGERVAWQPLLLLSGGEHTAVALPQVLAHWQRCWQQVRPRWPVVLRGEAIAIDGALVADLSERFAAVASHLPEAPPVAAPPAVLSLMREGSLLVITAEGTPDLLAPLRAAWGAVLAAVRHTWLSETTERWQVVLPWAPGRLWAFWWVVGAEQLTVAAEVVEAYGPPPSAAGCREVGGKWFVSWGEAPIPWVPLPVAGARQAPLEYAVLVVMRCGERYLGTGVDRVDPVGSVVVTPLADSTLPAYWTGWGLGGERLAPLFEPRLWFPSSFSPICR